MKLDVSETLDKNIEIVGLFDTEVSKVDNTFYISSKKTNKPGHPGTFALYADEYGTVESAGLGLEYDSEHEILATTTVTSTYLNTDNIDCNHITTKEIATDNLLAKSISTGHLDIDNLLAKSINTNDLTINNLSTRYVHFLNKNDNTIFASIHADYFKEETLAILTDKGDGTSACAIVIDKIQRVAIDQGRLNLRQKRTVLSSIGEPDDKQGDIAIDNNYLYYCTKNYNSKTDIWVRWNITDTHW